MIARLAGVSVPTVSRVINGRSDVAPQTRERVEELLTEHGYRRRSSSRTPHSALIDLVFNDLDSPWAVEIIRGVEDVAHGSGVGTVVSAIHRRTSSAKQWLDNMRARSTEGVIFVTSMVAPPLQAELRRLNLPVVIVDPAGVAPQQAPTIGATNWAGSLGANQYLIGLGHRRIGFIAGPPQLMCSRARMDGYRAALEGAGLAVEDALIRPGNFYHESGYVAGTQLLALPD
ncbi:LacI family DNA-binding transcriptional regulator, partial [Micromonospora echinofusca]